MPAGEEMLSYWHSAASIGKQEQSFSAREYFPE
jgi:hypothetical protein